MTIDPTATLTELELDALWTIYEGHSLLIERPQKEGAEPAVHAILSVEYDEESAVAEVAEIPLEAATALIEKGYLEASIDGPVLSEDSWYDEEQGCEILAEEYVLSELGELAIDATAEEEAEAGGAADA